MTELVALPKSRREARERGQKRYFTGKPCLQGHIAERNLSGKCIACRFPSALNGANTMTDGVKSTLAAIRK